MKTTQQTINALPFCRLLKAIADLEQQELELKNIIIRKHGDIEFGVSFDCLGVDVATFLKTPICHKAVFSNLIGDAILRPRLLTICDAIMGSKEYENIEYVHANFGMRVLHDPNVLLLQLHVSLIHRLYNEHITSYLAGSNDEDVTVPMGKKKPDECLQPKLVTYENGDLRIRLPRNVISKILWENVIRSILKYYRVEHKAVVITRDDSSILIDVTR